MLFSFPNDIDLETSSMGDKKYNGDRTVFAVAEYGREKIPNSIIILPNIQFISHSILEIRRMRTLCVEITLTDIHEMHSKM